MQVAYRQNQALLQQTLGDLPANLPRWNADRKGLALPVSGSVRAAVARHIRLKMPGFSITIEAMCKHSGARLYDILENLTDGRVGGNTDKRCCANQPGSTIFAA